MALTTVHVIWLKAARIHLYEAVKHHKKEWDCGCGACILIRDDPELRQTLVNMLKNRGIDVSHLVHG